MWPSVVAASAAPALIDSGTSDVSVYVIDYADSTQLNAEATIGMPSDWDGGTVTATFYWMINSTSTNAALFGCQGRSYGDAETLDQAFGSAQTVTDAGSGTVNQVLKSDATAAITLAGTPTAGEMVQFRIYRDGSQGGDTLTGITVRLLGVMITYTRS